MKAPSPASPRTDGRPRGATRLGLPLLAAVAAVVLLTLAARPGPSSPARAGEQDPAKEKPPAPGAVSHRQAIDRFETALAGIDRRLTALSNLVLEYPRAARRMRDQVGDFRIEAHKAEAAYLNAKLAREVAEIAVREYVEGTAVTELATVEGEIKLATSDLERSERNTAEARERLARISAAADQSAFGLNLVYTYTDRVTSAELLEKKAQYTLESAQGKKTILVKYTREMTTKKLESEVERAHADELWKQVMWDLSKGKLAEAQKEAKDRAELPEDRKRILALIDQAIPLEEKIRGRLGEAAKSDQLSDATSAEISRWLQDLAALADRAESRRDIDDFARLKSQIQQAAVRYKVSAAK